jgi:threonine/homoserine/homoserine lactone efflux protein
VDWHTLLQFLTAAILVIVSPGPVLAIIVHNTVRHGRLAGFLTAAGVEIGDLCLLGATFAGLVVSGKLLPMAFQWLSLAGALYLIWLAAKTLLSRHRAVQGDLPRCRWPMLDGLAVVISNPTALLFYTAFFPQFIDPDHPISEQMIVLSAVFVGAGVAFDAACVVAVARLRLPEAWRRIGRFAEIGSAIVYLTIAAITIFGFMEISDWVEDLGRY